jgi:two-component system, NarL family, invasion response regulator UvrY
VELFYYCNDMFYNSQEVFQEQTRVRAVPSARALAEASKLVAHGAARQSRLASAHDPGLKDQGGMNDHVKVLVIEDHPIVRDGCQRIFNRRPDIEAAEAVSAEAGLAKNREFAPDVIVLDVGLPDASGFDIIPQLLSDNARAKVIIFSMYEAPSFVTCALEKGAKGYITKNDDPTAILMAIDKVRTGAIYLGHAVAQHLAMANLAPINDPLRDLNERERQIMRLLGDGMSMTEISVELALGYKTIANGVAAIKQKLRIATSSALIKFAVELRTKA